MRLRGKTSESGFTIIELLLVMSVVMVALMVLSQSVGSAMKLTEVNRESALAMDGAQEMIELLDGTEDFRGLFALYNADPDDDPGLPGTAPGPGFFVEGLDPADDDPDGLVGEIYFPAEIGPTGLELYEIVADPDLAELLEMPRDIDGSGDLDGIDHSDDYQLLPVALILRWKGATGVRQLRILTMLADR
jgi:hypothetical protein